MADVADRQPDPLAVLRTYPPMFHHKTRYEWRDGDLGMYKVEVHEPEGCRRCVFDAALVQVEALVEAARVVEFRSTIGAYPEGRDLRSALAPFPRKGRT